MTRSMLLLLIVAVGASEASAQQDHDSVERARFCYVIEQQVEMGDWKPFRYDYEADLSTMAGAVVKPTDPENHNAFDTWAEASIKIQRLWNARHAEFWCEIPGYGKGNVLKLGVQTLFTKFLRDAITRHGMDPNKVDSADGCTLLDYAQYRIADSKTAGKDPYFIKEQEQIREYLVGAGAKHVYELEGYSHYPKSSPCQAKK